MGTFQSGEEGIERLVVMRDKLMLFGSHTALSEVPAVRWSQLDDLPLVTLTRDSGIRLLAEVGFEAATIPLKPAFEVRHITTALALVEAGLGVAVLPTYALAATRGLAIQGRPLIDPEIAREVALIHPSGRSTTPALSAFVATVRQFARRLVPSGPRADPLKDE